MVAAYPGPVITRYEIEPAVGVKGAQVVNLAKDLARSLSLVSIRVVETIPGKNYMALELPNAPQVFLQGTLLATAESSADDRDEVLAAIREQAERHLHVMVYGELVQEAQVPAPAID